MKRTLYKPYFSHDIYARQDNKIKNLLLHFRQESEDKAKAAVLIYWWIVEDMHKDEYKISNLAVYADDYRCDVNFLKSILEDFDLFRIENDCYISDRVLKNIAEQEEKSKKARQSAKNRWNKENNNTPKPQGDEETDYDEKLVNEFIQIFNKEFKKSQIVSNENKKRINKISRENKITTEIWKKTIQNAKRGWDIKGEGNKKPNLKNILDNWDLFASDNYYLAPDREAVKRAKDEAEKEIQTKRQGENEIVAKQEAEKNAAKEKICDKETAIEYINKYCYVPSIMLNRSSVVKEYCQEYGFTPQDILASRGENNA